MLEKLKHWIQLKIFYSVYAIQNEQKAHVISSMKRIGQCPIIENDFRFNGMKYIEIGNNFYCGRFAWVEALDNYFNQEFKPSLVIGDNFTMQNNCHIGCVDSIVIGDNVLLGSKVFITDHLHGHITNRDIQVPPARRPLSSKPVRIGNNVWIGDNVSIMPGVNLGNNVIVGANAVVTKSFMDNVVIAGVPAKVIKVL